MNAAASAVQKPVSVSRATLTQRLELVFPAGGRAELEFDMLNCVRKRQFEDAAPELAERASNVVEAISRTFGDNRATVDLLLRPAKYCETLEEWVASLEATIKPWVMPAAA